MERVDNKRMTHVLVRSLFVCRKCRVVSFPDRMCTIRLRSNLRANFVFLARALVTLSLNFHFAVHYCFRPDSIALAPCMHFD